jgi:SAM-dependent methyltransferase
MAPDDEGLSGRLERGVGALSYSVRRQLVDAFYARRVATLGQGALVVDLGGHRHAVRGLFDIRKQPLRLVTVNIDRSSRPDVLADVAALPFGSGQFDAAILSEVLEHVRNPRGTLEEAFRVLKPGGQLLLSVPFMYHVHADPDDYARYTDRYLKSVLTEIGFVDIEVERQGRIFGVLSNLLKLLANELATQGLPRNPVQRLALQRVAIWLHGKSKGWDAELEQGPFAGRTTGVVMGSTTGYGIVCRRGAA